MRKIRLGVDCRAVTQNMSGVGRYVLNLLKHVGKSEEFHLFILARNDLHPELHTIPNATLVSLPKEAQSIHYVDRLRWEQQFLATQLRTLKLDIFHATWNYGIPLVRTCPSVLTLHDLLPMEFPGEFGSRSWRLAYLASQYIALYRATRIIAVSQYTKDTVAQYARFASTKTTVILEGVEEEFRPPPPSFNERSYILYVGGYGERKNVGNLLRAYEFATTTLGVNQPLCLTGSPERLLSEDRKIFDELSACVRGQIKFLGFVSDAELPALYQGASMLAFPSLGEGFGFPPLEAMACGTPVVTTKCGSIPEVVGDAARFVDGVDPKSIAHGIADIANNATLRSDLVERGFTRSASLSWKISSEATMKIYREVFAGEKKL